VKPVSLFLYKKDESVKRTICGILAKDLSLAVWGDFELLGNELFVQIRTWMRGLGTGRSS
jgi:hypothetical protein